MATFRSLVRKTWILDATLFSVSCRPKFQFLTKNDHFWPKIRKKVQKSWKKIQKIWPFFDIFSPFPPTFFFEKSSIKIENFLYKNFLALFWGSCKQIFKTWLVNGFHRFSYDKNKVPISGQNWLKITKNASILHLEQVGASFGHVDFCDFRRKNIGLYQSGGFSKNGQRSRLFALNLIQMRFSCFSSHFRPV